MERKNHFQSGVRRRQKVADLQTARMLRKFVGGVARSLAIHGLVGKADIVLWTSSFFTRSSPYRSSSRRLLACA